MSRVKQIADDLFDEAETKEEEDQPEQAFALLLAAAKLGHTWSQVHLGNYYSSGVGVRPDFKKAEKWYRRAAKKGNSSAAFNLAIDLETQGRVNGARRWFQRAIQLGHGEAYLSLAKLTKNRKYRLSLLRRALELPKDQILDEYVKQAEHLLTETYPQRGFSK